MDNNAFNSLKIKDQQYFDDVYNFGREKITRGGVVIEIDRLPDSDQELCISIEDTPNEAQMGTIVSPNLKW